MCWCLSNPGPRNLSPADPASLPPRPAAEMLSFLLAALAQAVDYLQSALPGFSSSCCPAPRLSPLPQPVSYRARKEWLQFSLEPHSCSLLHASRAERNTVGILEDLLCRPLISSRRKMDKKSGNWNFQGLCCRPVPYKTASIHARQELWPWESGG